MKLFLSALLALLVSHTASASSCAFMCEGRLICTTPATWYACTAHQDEYHGWAGGGILPEEAEGMLVTYCGPWYGGIVHTGNTCSGQGVQNADYHTCFGR